MTSKTDVLYEIRFHADFKPEHSLRANVKKVVTKNQDSFILRNHVTGEYYEIDDLTNKVWSLMDGKRTIGEILAEVESKSGQVGLERVRDIVLFFGREGCLRTVEEETVSERLISFPSPFEIDIRLLKDSRRLTDILHREIKFLLKGSVLWISVILILVGIGVFANTYVSMLNDEQNFMILDSTIVGFFYYFFVFLLPVIVIHELAHALALFHYGGEPKEIGFGLYYFGPMFYANTSDAWTLGRRERIMVSAAGPISTLLTGAVAALGNLLLPFPDVVSKFLNLYAFWCFYIISVDFNPGFETDSYYILADGLNIPNLRQEAIDYLKTALSSILKGHFKETRSQYTKRRRLILTSYAVLVGASLLLTLYSTSKLLLYMTSDALAAFLSISGLTSLYQPMYLAGLLVGLASLAYFTMVIVGYGVLGISIIHKATIRQAQFETVNDKKLTVFFYLPPSAPEELVKELEGKMRHEYRKLTRSFETGQIGSVHYAQLKLGNVKKPIDDIEREMTRAELALRFKYTNFLIAKKRDLLQSAGIYSKDGTSLANLLRRVSRQIAKTPGCKNAKTIADTIIRNEEENSLYLLSSPFGIIWTLEVDSEECEAFRESWHPSLLIEDLSFTDLYGDNERFRRYMIFEAELLSDFMQKIEKEENEVFTQPDKYQALALFEPIKNSLVFIGRVQELESKATKFSDMFFIQAWSGYYRHLLNEVDYGLEVSTKLVEDLCQDESIKKLTLGELVILNRNLKEFVTSTHLISESLEKLKDQLSLLNQKTSPSATASFESEDFKVGFLDAIYWVNTNKISDIAERVDRAKQNFAKVNSEMSNLQQTIEEISKDRKTTYLKRKSRMLTLYPIVLALSIVFLLAYPSLISIFQTSFPWMSMTQLMTFTLAAPTLIQGTWGVAYYTNWRNTHHTGPYHTSIFDTAQLLIASTTELVYPLVVTNGILSNQT